MKFELLCVGKVKAGFVRDGEREYLNRIKGGHSLIVTEISPEEGKHLSEKEIKNREGVRILQRLIKSPYAVALDESGQGFTSRDFAQAVQNLSNRGVSQTTFVIGGAFGLSDEVKSKCSLVMSLSQLTFPYQLARLVLVEQLYRVVTLIEGKPYHK